MQLAHAKLPAACKGGKGGEDSFSDLESALALTTKEPLNDHNAREYSSGAFEPLERLDKGQETGDEEGVLNCFIDS